MLENSTPPTEHDELPQGLGTIEAMQAAVESRAAQRAKKEAAVVLAPLSETAVLRCEQEEFLGDGKIYSYLNRNKFVYVQLQEKWLYWKGHHWAFDVNIKRAKEAVDVVAQEYLRVAWLLKNQETPTMEKDEKEELAKKRQRLFARAKRCRRRDRLTVLDFAHTGADPLSIDGEELDADPWLLGCANGVIDLRSCEHRPGRPDDYITKACSTDWQGLEADGQPFLDFLLQMFGTQEMVEFILRFFGMALLGYQRERKFLVLFGEGGSNGKDTLMNILIDVLGQEMCSTIPQELLMEQSFVADAAKPSPHLMALRGKRIVYASETSKKHRFNAERVKDLTGTGEMQARGLQENNMTKWEKSHTLVLLTNELPAAPVHDTAFWDRLLGVELVRRFVDNPDPEKPLEFSKDPDLRVKMRGCKSGILALLVKYFRDYMQGGLRPPPEVKAFGDEYRKSEDLVGLFLDDCCATDPADVGGVKRTQASMLYDCFSWWYAKNISKKAQYNNRRFSKEMQRKGWNTTKVSNLFYFGIEIDPVTKDEWESSRPFRRERSGGDND